MATSASTIAVIRASRPTFRSQHDKVAFAIHAYCICSGLKLLAVGDAADTADVSTSAPEAAVDGWATRGPEQYAFHYALGDVGGSSSGGGGGGVQPAGGSLRLLVKCLAMDRLLLVSAAAGASIGSLAAPETTEIDVDAVAAAESDETSMAAAYRDVDGLLARLRPVLEAAVARVRPKPAAPTTTASSTAGAPLAADDTTAQQPSRSGRVPRPPGWDQPPPPMLPVGRGDVMPSLGPGLRMPGGIPAGGGMQVGPGHPYFMDRLRHPELQPGMGGLRPPPPGLGGGGLQPPVPGLPPGARWDPIAPEGLQGWQPDDFTRPRFPPPGPPGNPQQPPDGAVHPDIQQPGAGRGTDWDSMYG